jgi:hypothetical protein
MQFTNRYSNTWSTDPAFYLANNQQSIKLLRSYLPPSIPLP